MYSGIFSEQRVKKIKDGFDIYIEYLEHFLAENRNLQYRNEILLKDAKEIANRELLEENLRLKNQLKLSIGQFSSQRELDDYNSFCEEHIHDRTISKANGRKTPYVIQEGTGIGIITKVKCPICGVEEDITDLEAW